MIFCEGNWLLFHEHRSLLPCLVQDASQLGVSWVYVKYLTGLFYGFNMKSQKYIYIKSYGTYRQKKLTKLKASH